MIRIMLLVLGVVFITGCEVQRTVYLNEKGEEIPPPEQGMPDHSHRLAEVCVNGVVYYYRISVHQLSYTPKVVNKSLQPFADKKFYETC